MVAALPHTYDCRETDRLTYWRPSAPAILLPSTGVFTLLASGSRSPEGTDAAEAVDLVHAGGPVGTGGRLALVYICRGSRGIRSGSNPMKTNTGTDQHLQEEKKKQINKKNVCLLVSSLRSSRANWRVNHCPPAPTPTQPRSQFSALSLTEMADAGQAQTKGMENFRVTG